MSIAREYAQSLRTHLRCRAVWPPLVDVVPGDYGVFRGGVFMRVGNVTTDFGVPTVTESGGHRADKFQYHSDGSRGFGADVGLAATAAKVGVDIGLQRRSSFFVSIAQLDIVRLQSPRTVASRLRERDDWAPLRYFVVHELLMGRDLVFYGAENGSGGVTLRGDLDDIKAFQALGRVGGSLEFSASSDVNLQYRGSKDAVAPFGLNLFRVKAVGAEPLLMTFADPGAGARGDVIAARDDDDEPLVHLAADDDDDDFIDDSPTRIA